MRTVTVRRLKAHLSEYLRAVKRGEVVLVTDGDQVVAELRAPGRDRELPEGLTQTLHALAAVGEVTRAPAAKRGWRWTTKGLGLNPRTVATILDDLRAESLSG